MDQKVKHIMGYIALCCVVFGIVVLTVEFLIWDHHENHAPELGIHYYYGQDLDINASEIQVTIYDGKESVWAGVLAGWTQTRDHSWRLDGANLSGHYLICIKASASAAIVPPEWGGSNAFYPAWVSIDTTWAWGDFVYLKRMPSNISANLFDLNLNAITDLGHLFNHAPVTCLVSINASEVPACEIGNGNFWDPIDIGNWPRDMRLVLQFAGPVNETQIYGQDRWVEFHQLGNSSLVRMISGTWTTSFLFRNNSVLPALTSIVISWGDDRVLQLWGA